MFGWKIYFCFILRLFNVLDGANVPADFELDDVELIFWYIVDKGRNKSFAFQQTEKADEPYPEKNPGQIRRRFGRWWFRQGSKNEEEKLNSDKVLQLPWKWNSFIFGNRFQARKSFAWTLFCGVLEDWNKFS